MLVPTSEACRLTNMSGNTLRKYANQGKLHVVRFGERGQRRFDTEELLKLSKGESEETCEQNPIVCYCRVSSAKQKNDLVRQVAFMRQQFPNAEIIQDIGSGLNFKRKGLQSILQRIMQKDKFSLIIAHRDRLCRFGIELFEFMLKQNGGELLVLDNTEVSPQRELTEDLLAILHVFSCRMHGLRRYTSEIEKDKTLSYQGTENTV